MLQSFTKQDPSVGTVQYNYAHRETSIPLDLIRKSNSIHCVYNCLMCVTNFFSRELNITFEITAMKGGKALSLESAGHSEML